MSGGRRRYVRVRCEVDEDGTPTPLVVLWGGGIAFEVTKVARSERWACMGTGRGRRFTVWFGGYQTYLYWDGMRWYVLERERTLAHRPLADGNGSNMPK